MSDQTIIFDVRGNSAWIRLNRPAALNSINALMVAELNDALDACEGRRELRSLVLLGEGRTFCSGADLKEARSRAEGPDGENAARAFLDSVRRLSDRIAAFPRPVIAAVGGMALAGGLELLLCCDLIVAAESATFGDAHANYGLLPGGGASARLPRRIGVSRAKHMMFTGAFLPASVMHEWGLVNVLVPDGSLEAEAGRLADQVGEKSPLGLSRMKALVDDGMEMSVTAALHAEQVMAALHTHSDDRREGLRAFSEKRKPVFSGT